MKWFNCDESGNVLFNIFNILKILQNNSVPTITQNQSNILSAIQNIASSGSFSSNIPEEQLNQILSAIQNIPSNTLINNQNNILSGLTPISSNINDAKLNTDSMKAAIDNIYGTLEDYVIGTLKAGETSITLTSDGITEGINLDVYTSIYGVNPLTININNGSVTLTFKEQSGDMGVKVTFKRDINWEAVATGKSYTTKINDVIQRKNLNFRTAIADFSVSTLPYEFYDGSAVVLNNEIHILKGTMHYKYDGSTWTSVSTLPYEFFIGSAVVLNNEIHILGGYDKGSGNHYEYNGSAWTSVSTLPYEFFMGSAVVLNNEIHILGGDKGSGNHYKYDGSTWTSVSTLPFSGFRYGGAVVYNDEIHILKGTMHYKYDGSTWTEVSTLPYDFYCGSAVALNNEIHILGNNGGDTTHYKWNGSTWTSVSALPYKFANGSAVVPNNEIHILGSNYGNYTKHYALDALIYKKI